MVKKKRKSPRKAREKVDEECVALVRAYFKRSGADVQESNMDGAHVFTGVFTPTECVISLVRCVVVVEGNSAKAACEIPLRVPKSCVSEVLGFVNAMNCRDQDCGTLFLDSENNMVTILNDCPVSVIKSDVEKAMEDGDSHGYDLRTIEHRYFFVEKFYETDFKKITPRAPMGSRVFDLTQILGTDDLPNTEEMAERLKNETWT